MSIPFWYTLYQQTSLFPEEEERPKRLTHSGINMIVGQFFELLTRQAFPEARPLDEVAEDGSMPDLVLWRAGPKRGDVLLEVKASCKGHLIETNQLERYRSLVQGDFPFTRARLFYVLWCYDMTDIYKRCPYHTQLLDELIECDKSAYVLPASLVGEICDRRGARSYTSWTWGDGSGTTYTRMLKSHHRVLQSGGAHSLRTVLEALRLRTNGHRFREYRLSHLEVRGEKLSAVQTVIVSSFSFNKLLGGS